MNDDDEWLDVVDAGDNVTGRQLRSVATATCERNFRCVNAFIRNSRGELWIPRRTAAKRNFPLCLDISMGGHVGAGEPYELAFRRETQEELGLNIDQVKWRITGAMTPPQHGVSSFMRIYEISLDDTPAYNRDDYLEWWWLTPAQLLARLDADEPAKDDLAPVVRFIYS